MRILLYLLLLVTIAEARLTPAQWAIIENKAGHRRLLWRIVANNIEKPKKKDIIKVAKGYLGVRYKWGGESKRGIDCSALVVKATYKTFKIRLERTSTEQYYNDKNLVKVQKPRVGDLIYFRTNRHRRGGIGHVAIVIDVKKHLMIEAWGGKSHKVRIASYNTSRRKRQFAGYRRIDVFKAPNS